MTARITTAPAQAWDTEQKLMVECLECSVEWGWGADSETLQKAAESHNSQLHATAEPVPSVAEQKDALTKLKQIRDILDSVPDPRCDVHPDDDDGIVCGWKRTVADIRWVLENTTTENRENHG